MDINMKFLTDEELKNILITCDGKGKEIKLLALEELCSREFRNGMASIENGED